ncbi:TIM barrel protein [Candidatus Woesearchaeota archaeon]|nr:TIM barrel protein [Candidatus Woesearchaeota archaeon]
MSFTKLNFGTAGIPISTEDRSTENGIRRIKELGLGSMELEFVRVVNISKEKAPIINKIREENDIVLTCHGQYFINLNAVENEKIAASKQRILNAARIANLCGAFSMTFHAAYYLNMEKASVYKTVKDNLKEIIEILKQENNKIWIRPETTGKETQFGNMQEILQLSQELDQIMPCIDFSHLHARYNGKFNTYEEFSQILQQVEKALGKEGLHNMHIHTAGIAYTAKGEKNHLNLKDSDLNYKELCKAWKDFGIKGAVTCESPNIEEDALLLKKTYENS